MAKSLIEIAIQLGSKLGANTSRFMGTRTNVSFLGSGPKDGMLFQKSINPESVSTIGIEKIIPDIESSLAYATGGKLNDIQLNKLIQNLKTMDETLNPTNVIEMGMDSLRAKSGLGERQLTEAAGDVKSIDDAAAGVNAADESPLMSRLKNRVQGIRDETEAATGIMATVPKADLPGKTAASREFLVNALKKEDINQTTFGDIVDPADMKFIMEGGGGVDADPIVLVQKYFGPRVAEMVPVGGTAEEIAIFTDRVLKNMVDAKGLKPTEFGFDNMTARFVDQLADGGIAGLETRQGLKFGGKIAKNILSKIDDTMIKKAADDIFPTDDYKYDAEMVVEALVENNPKLFKNLLADDLDDALRSDLYGLAVRETGGRLGAKIKANRVGNVVDTTVTEKVTPKGFRLNVERAVSDLNIPRAEAIRISQLPSDQQKLELQKYLDRDFSQRITLGDYNPKTFDAAKGGLAKILEL